MYRAIQIIHGEERMDFLREQGLCYHCGQKFHGVRKPKDTNTTGSKCEWSKEMKVVNCLLQNRTCNNSAATCSFHSGQQNVSDELKT